MCSVNSIIVDQVHLLPDQAECVFIISFLYVFPELVILRDPVLTLHLLADHAEDHKDISSSVPAAEMDLCHDFTSLPASAFSTAAEAVRN